jgi:hypothetical protein
VSRDELHGIALPLAAFEALQDAMLVEDELRAGKSALPPSRDAALDRARRIVDVLRDADVPQPDTYVVAKIPSTQVPEPLEETWHVAPLYPVQFPDGRMMKAVVDPFLRHAPLGLLDWQMQLGVRHVELVSSGEITEAPPGLDSTLSGGGAGNFQVTTKRGGSGTAADSHGLAKLLRAWLKDPSDASQVERFRTLFGEVAWRSLETAYPKLVQQVDLELERHARK